MTNSANYPPGSTEVQRLRLDFWTAFTEFLKETGSSLPVHAPTSPASSGDASPSRSAGPVPSSSGASPRRRSRRPTWSRIRCRGGWRWGRAPLNSPNDVVCKSDGSIWFTDPPFGILGYYEGYAATPGLGTNVYRVDGATGRITVATGDVNRPNGLAFSPDESKLYIVVSGDVPRRIDAYDVVDGGTRLANGRPFIDAGPGTPDGFRSDVDGNLWCGWGMGQEGLDGVSIFSPAGQLIGRIDLPERCANLCFGGTHRNRLFMAASTSLYSLYVNTQGVAGG